MLTARQQHLIQQSKDLGYGYRLFAVNVEKQGWCSPKQEVALENMVSAGNYRKNNWSGNKYYTRRYKGEGYVEWDDYHWGDFDSSCASEDFWL